MRTVVMRAVRSHRLVFLSVAGVTFLVMAIGALALPKQLTIVRTLVNSGFVEIGERQEPFEQPDLTARKILRVYGPIALSELRKSETPPSILGELRLPEVDVTGFSLLIVNTVDARIENETKAFQRSIADQILKAQVPRAEAIRRTLAEQAAGANDAIRALDLLMSSIAAEIERIDAASEKLKSQIEQQKSELAKFEQGPSFESMESGPTLEVRLRLHEQIAAQAKSVGELSVERARLTRQLVTLRQDHTRQITSLTRTQSEATTVTDASVSLAQLALPFSSSSRLYGMLLIAFAIAILIAFGAVATLHNIKAENG